mgnify:CR=1 FL=1
MEFGTAGYGKSVCRVRIKTDQSAEQFREEAGGLPMTHTQLPLITEIIRISLKTAPGMDWLNGRTGAESKICLHS